MVNGVQAYITMPANVRMKDLGDEADHRRAHGVTVRNK